MRRPRKPEGRSFPCVASTAESGATKNSNVNSSEAGKTSKVLYHRLLAHASSLNVARASAAMLANAMIDLKREREAVGAPIGERLGTLILAAQAIYGELGRLPALEAIA